MDLPLGFIFKPVYKLFEYIVVKEKPNDVQFRMNDPYLPQYPNPEVTTHCRLTTLPSTNRNVASFTFLDNKDVAIGYAGQFQRLTRNSQDLQTNYYFRGPQDRERFLNSITSSQGKISAVVTTSNGENFIYTYKAKTDNWRTVKQTRHPTLNDVFELVEKRRKFF